MQRKNHHSAREAGVFFEPVNRIQPDGKVRCEICPRQCTLNDGGLGACKTRAGGGKLPFYGYISSAAVDPIEKKPLFHYRPGENIFSIGFTGCNMRCPFCQNWHISQTTDTAAQMIPPEEIITKTTALGLKQIAYTYTEPLIHLEYLIDCMTLARARGIANVLVTNGCVTPKAAAAIMPLTDAVNVDLKCFSESKYQKILGGSLSAVKHFIKASSSAGVHTEITTLIVPDFNDSEQEIDRCIDFIASISNNIPWHISAYHPAYKWTTPPTKPETILAIKKHAKQKLLYCYTGNIIDDDNDTFCANCDSVLLRRDNYKIKKLELVKKNEDGIYYCGQCGAKTPLQY